METAIAARPMVYKEARECVDNINANMNDVRHLVYDLYTREGWSALGHKTWRECVTAEFKQSQSYLYYQLEAAQGVRMTVLNYSMTALRNHFDGKPMRKLTSTDANREYFLGKQKTCHRMISEWLAL